MPTPIYTAQITLYSYFPLPSNLANPPASGLDQPVWWVGLAASDDANTWYIAVELLYSFAATNWSVRTTYYHTLGSTPDSFAQPGGISTADNVAPFPFAGSQDYDVNPSPGTFTSPQDWLISITKDFNNDRIRFGFPWTPNTHDYALSNPLFVKDTSALRPTAIFSLDHGGNQNASPTGYTSEFRNLAGLKDGVPFVAAALSSADPGTWDPTTQFLPVSSPAIDNLDGQLTDGYRLGYTQTPPNPPPYATERERDFVRGNPVTITELDARQNPASGQLCVAGVMADAPMALTFWRSVDDAVTLSPSPADGDPAENFCFPSVVPWPDGRVAVFYQKNGQATQLHYVFSENDGQTWTRRGYFCPEATAITAPRVRFDPASGLLFVAYFEVAAAQLRLRRFGALLTGAGSPAAPDPVTVAGGVSAFEQPELWWDERGRAHLFFINGTTPTIQRSEDYGVTWATVATFAAGARRREFTAALAGLTAHSYQTEPGGSFPTHVELSDDGGQTNRRDTVVTTLSASEYCPLAEGPRNQLWLVTAQLSGGVLVPRVYRSDDLSVDWASVTTSPP